MAVICLKWQIRSVRGSEFKAGIGIGMSWVLRWEANVKFPLLVHVYAQCLRGEDRETLIM